MSIVPFLISYMPLLLTLVHIALFAFPLVLLIFTFRSLKKPTQAPEGSRSKPDLPKGPSNPSTPQGPASMPSLFHHPPTKVLEGQNHTAPSHIPRERFQTTPQTDPTGVKQPYDAFLVLDVEATCFQGTGFEWANEIIVRPSTPSHSC